MSLLLTKIYDAATPSDPDALRSYAPAFDATLEYNTMRPLIEEAELAYIRPTFGDPLIDELITARDAASLNLVQDTALRRIQRAAAHFTRYQYLTMMSVRASSAGPGETVSNDGGHMMPRQWVMRDALRDCWYGAHLWVDQAIAYVEQNESSFSAAFAPAFFTAAGLANNLRDQGHFIATTAELAEHVPSNVNRVVFLRLAPVLTQAQDRYLRPVLGEPFYQELRTALKDPATLSAAQIIVIQKARKALAHWALARALPHLQLQISQAGLVIPVQDSSSNRPNKALQDEIRAMWIELDQAAQEFLNDLVSYLNRNAADYPTFQNSDWHQPPVTDPDEIEPFKGGPVWL